VSNIFILADDVISIIVSHLGFWSDQWPGEGQLFWHVSYWRGTIVLTVTDWL